MFGSGAGVRCFRRLCAELSVSGWVLRSEGHAGDRVREVAGVSRVFPSRLVFYTSRRYSSRVQCVSPERASLGIASL